MIEEITIAFLAGIAVQIVNIFIIGRIKCSGKKPCKIFGCCSRRPKDDDEQT